MDKITLTLLLALGLLATPLGLTAQDIASDSLTVTEEQDSTLVRPDYATLLGITDWDKLDEDAVLPITRDQAEELIVSLIVAGRADALQARREAEIVKDFKVEMLKHRLLESALKKVYTEGYEQRIDRLERLLLIALSKDNGGKLDPTIVQYLLEDKDKQSHNDDLGRKLLQAFVGKPTSRPATSDEKQADKKGESQKLIPDSAKVPLAPGVTVPSWEHFLSRVYFDFDSDKLTDEAKAILDNVAGWILETKMAVELRGYASPEGNMRYNNRLSERRVVATADYLRQRGIADEYLHLVPSGEDTIKATSRQYPDARRVDIRPYYGE